MRGFVYQCKKEPIDMGHQLHRKFNESMETIWEMRNALDYLQELFEETELIHQDHQEWKKRLTFFKDNRKFYKHVYALPINREDVIWYSDERGEEEIVLLPFNLRHEPILLQEAKPPDKEKYMERFFELSKEREQGVTANV
jgi:hypothetical protein